MNRTDLIPFLPEAVKGAVTYATEPHASQAGHIVVHAASRAVLREQEMSVRLALHDVSDRALRQYQIDRFEAAAAPASKLQPESIHKRVRGAAAERILSDVVAGFQQGQRLFRHMDGAPRGRVQFWAASVGNGDTIARLFSSLESVGRRCSPAPKHAARAKQKWEG